MIVLRDIHQFFSRVFCGNYTTLQCPSSSFPYPYFPMAWTSFQEAICEGCLYHTLVVADLQTQNPICSGA
jgi:hypothetical protein